VNWIKWDVVCLPKSKGGLGVRDIRVVNISLLTKWRWKLLQNDNALWKEVLVSKYGEGVMGRAVLGDDTKPWFASLWWRDICSIGFLISIGSCNVRLKNWVTVELQAFGSIRGLVTFLFALDFLDYSLSLRKENYRWRRCVKLVLLRMAGG
jgi:hypothetical protein